MKLPEFQSAKWVKVNPDRPQAEVRTVVFWGPGEHALGQQFSEFKCLDSPMLPNASKVRATVLRSGKMLLVPQPRRDSQSSVSHQGLQE